LFPVRALAPRCGETRAPERRDLARLQRSHTGLPEGGYAGYRGARLAVCQRASARPAVLPIRRPAILAARSGLTGLDAGDRLKHQAQQRVQRVVEHVVDENGNAFGFGAFHQIALALADSWQ
jgi:hypothetical protein